MIYGRCVWCGAGLAGVFATSKWSGGLLCIPFPYPRSPRWWILADRLSFLKHILDYDLAFMMKGKLGILLFKLFLKSRLIPRFVPCKYLVVPSGNSEVVQLVTSLLQIKKPIISILIGSTNAYPKIILQVENDKSEVCY